MGLFNEHEAVCDHCGRVKTEQNISTSSFKKSLREAGWQLGALVFCPSCTRVVKGQQGVTYTGN